MDDNPRSIEKSQLLPSSVSSEDLKHCAFRGDFGEQFQKKYEPETPVEKTYIVNNKKEIEGRTATPRSDLSGGGSGATGLTCLSSNNSAEQQKIDTEKNIELALKAANLLTNYHKKQAHTLMSNVKRFFCLIPSTSHALFLTLTFKDHITDFKEASRRFNSMAKHLFKESGLYGVHWIRSAERQKSGRMHYHLLIETKKEVSSGWDWSGYQEGMKAKKEGKTFAVVNALCKKTYVTRNAALKEIWDANTLAMANYGFGVSSALPIRSNEEAVAFYIGKYVSKHVGAREKRDLGMRLITYSQGWGKNSMKISWYNKNSIEWRRKTEKFIRYTIGSTGKSARDHHRMSQIHGKRWVWKFREEIFDIDFIVYEKNQEIPF